MGKITFNRPPLVEVSFGLSFAALRDLRTAHFGAFWSRLRPDFTETADKPLVADSPGMSSFVGGEEWFPLPRVWYIHRDKEQILQLQTDRFYFNWRRIPESSLYPRFDSLQPVFRSYVQKLREFVESEGLGVLDITGCELSYTNHIYKNEGWSDLSEVSQVFPQLSCCASKTLGQPLGFMWQSVFNQQDLRLTADVKYGSTREDPKRELFIFEMRAKSRQKMADLETVHATLSRSNEAIVDAFVTLTSDRVQKEHWDRVE